MAKGELHVELYVHYADDPKLEHVSRGARLLYVDALCKAKALLNDGVLTPAQVEKLAYPDRPAAARKQAAELVQSGAWLWDEDRKVYTIAAWLRRNKSRAEVEQERNAKAAEQARKGAFGNHERWHTQRGLADPRCEFCPSPDDRQPIATGDPPAIPNDRSETETETETETKPIPPSAGADVAAPPDETEGQRVNRLTKIYVDHPNISMANFPAVAGVVRKAVRSGRYHDRRIAEALTRLGADGRSVTVETLRLELDGQPTGRAAPRANGQQIDWDAAMDRARAREEATR
jgi:hypothetical protein